MDFEIPEELKIMKDTMRKFVQKEIAPRISEIDRNNQIPDDLIRKLAEVGYTMLHLPEKYGGLELGMLAQCLVEEEFGAYIPIVMRVYPGLAAMAIVSDGTEEQKAKYLPGIAKGEIVTAIGFTEPGAGSDLSAIETTAVRDGSNFIINGRKHFITNGPIADVVLLLTLTDKKLRARGGMTTILVEKGTSGFSVGAIEESMGLRGSQQSELIFEDCIVPAKNVVGKEGEGFLVTMKHLDEGRLLAGASTIGLAEKALEMAIDYAKQRVQFGKPIADNQAIQWMLADSAVEIYAAKMMLYNAAWKKDQGRRVNTESAMVKLFSTEMACRVVDRTVQIHGGMGIMKEIPVERLYRDVRFTTIAEGSSEILRIIIARDFLKRGISPIIQ